MALLRAITDKRRLGARRERRRRLKGVAVLPTMLTLANLLLGFAAIYFAMRAVFAAAAGIDPAESWTLRNEQLERVMPSFLAIGAWCIAFGMICDGLDGRIARVSGRTSRFGSELDSLADVVSFVLAPACLMVALLVVAYGGWYATPLSDDTFGRGRWMMIGLYVVCGGIRLARFNVESTAEESAHRGFKGLPTPAAAGMVIAWIALHEHLIYYGTRTASPIATAAADWLVTAAPFITVVLSLLMVSRFDYTHLISVYLRKRRPIGQVVFGFVVLVALVLYTEPVAVAGFAVYVLTGPIRAVVRLFGVGAGRPTPAPAAELEGSHSEKERRHA
jgi:CDP-diacylglycerol--serine O-phosphatidyltransferase